MNPHDSEYVSASTGDSSYAIAFLFAGQRDAAAAQLAFAFDHMLGDFNIWTETNPRVPTPGNFYVNLPPLFLGHFSPIFPRLFPMFSPFSPSFPQDSGNRHQDPEERSVTVERRRDKPPKLT